MFSRLRALRFGHPGIPPASKLSVGLTIPPSLRYGTSGGRLGSVLSGPVFLMTCEENSSQAVSRIGRSSSRPATAPAARPMTDRTSTPASASRAPRNLSLRRSTGRPSGGWTRARVASGRWPTSPTLAFAMFATWTQSFPIPTASSRVLLGNHWFISCLGCCLWSGWPATTRPSA